MTVPSYTQAHLDHRSAHGDASARACVDCGEQARDWSYDGADPDELLSTPSAWGTRSPYSLKAEHYAPRCRRCHCRLDGIPSGRAS